MVLVDVWHPGHLFVGLWHQLQKVSDLFVLEAHIASLKGDALLLCSVSLLDLLLELAHLSRLKVAEGACPIRGKVKLSFWFYSSFVLFDLLTGMAKRVLRGADGDIVDSDVLVTDAFFE